MIHGEEENSLIDTFKEVQRPQRAVEPVMMMMIVDTKYKKNEKMKLNDERLQDVQSFSEEILSILR